MSYISHSDYKNLMSKFQAKTPKGILKEAVEVKDRGYQDNITPESPLDEEMEEGNAFTGQLHTHKPGQKFKVKGKTYTDTAKSVVPEYRFDQMYPDDPGPFEGDEMEENIYEPLQKATGITTETLRIPKRTGYNDTNYDPRDVASWQPDYMKGEHEPTDDLDDDDNDFDDDADDLSDLPNSFKKQVAQDKDRLNREQSNDTNPPFGFSPVAGEVKKQLDFEALSIEERKQLKDNINAIKEIKKSINGLLEKAGKNSMMESSNAGYVEGEKIKNPKKEADIKRPATLKPKYHNPEKKQKSGGNRTDLVLKKGEMWESHEPDMDPKHEEMESKINPKLHDILHNVADKIIQELEGAGFTRFEALAFIEHEIEEKGEEAKMSQYDL